MKPQRNTRQRRLILEAVKAHCDHPNADQIYLDVRAQDDKISRGTVYRNLNILVRRGDVVAVKLPQSDRFESRLDTHYHVICKNCYEVSDLPFEYRKELDSEAAEKTGYSIERHRTVFEGLCPNCQQHPK